MGLSHLSWNSTHRSKRSSSSSESGYRLAVPHLPSHPDCEHSVDLLLWCKDLELMAREQDRETDRQSIQAEAESQRRQMLGWVPTAPGIRQSGLYWWNGKCFYFIFQEPNSLEEGKPSLPTTHRQHGERWTIAWRRQPEYETQVCTMLWSYFKYKWGKTKPMWSQTNLKVWSVSKM